jgi:hypothetical protein
MQQCNLFFFFFFFSSLSSQVHHGRRGENFELKTSERRRTSRVFIWTLLFIIRKHFFLFLAFILLREMLGEDAGLFRYYTQHAYVYYTVERIYSVHLYELVCMYRRWRSRHRHDFKCLNGEITFEGSYHFAVVRIESLVDQRELFTAETTLQIQQMAKHPRLILSSHNHYQLMASAISFLTFCILFVFLGGLLTKDYQHFPLYQKSCQLIRFHLMTSKTRRKNTKIEK